MCMIWLVEPRICQQKKGRQQEKVSCKLSISKLPVHLTLASSEATCSAISHQVKMKLSLNEDSEVQKKIKEKKIKRGEKEIILNLLYCKMRIESKAETQGNVFTSPSPQTVI